jgi:hypothetical protein
MRCPICKKDVAPGSPDVPFCSDRCRLIDLGNWATDQYRIPVPSEPEFDAEEADDNDANRK